MDISYVIHIYVHCVVFWPETCVEETLRRENPLGSYGHYPVSGSFIRPADNPLSHHPLIHFGQQFCQLHSTLHYNSTSASSLFSLLHSLSRSLSQPSLLSQSISAFCHLPFLPIRSFAPGITYSPYPPPTAAWPLSSGGSLPTEHVDRAALHNAETNHRCIGHDLTIRTHWPHVFPSFSAGF